MIHRVTFVVLLMLVLLVVQTSTKAEEADWGQPEIEVGKIDDAHSVYSVSGHMHIDIAMENAFMPATFILKNGKATHLTIDGIAPKKQSSDPAIVDNQLLYFAKLREGQKESVLISIVGSKITELSGDLPSGPWTPRILSPGGTCPYFIVENSIFKLTKSKVKKIWSTKKEMIQRFSSNGKDMVFQNDGKVMLLSGDKVSVIRDKAGDPLSITGRSHFVGSYIYTPSGNNNVYQLKGTKAELLKFKKVTVQNLFQIGKNIYAQITSIRGSNLDEQIKLLKGGKLKPVKALKGIGDCGYAYEQHCVSGFQSSGLLTTSGIIDDGFVDCILDGSKAIKVKKPAQYKSLQIVNAVKFHDGYLCVLGKKRLLAKQVLIFVDSKGVVTLQKNKAGEILVGGKIELAECDGVVCAIGKSVKEHAATFKFIYK